MIGGPKTWRHEKKKKPRMCWGLEKYDAPGKCCGLAERIHQFIDRAVQVLSLGGEAVDLVDRMKDRGVVLCRRTCRPISGSDAWVAV